MEDHMSSQSSNEVLVPHVPDSTVEKFLQHGRYLRNWSPRTVRAYGYALSELPAEITKAALDAWVIGCRQKPHTPGGMNVRIRAVNSLHGRKRLDGKLLSLHQFQWGRAQRWSRR